MTFQPLGTIAIVTDRRANSVAFEIRVEANEVE
jgi:hypothetical protein